MTGIGEHTGEPSARVPAKGGISESGGSGAAISDHSPVSSQLRGQGSVPAETIVTFITPPGAPIRDDAPPPPGCNP